MLQWTIDRTDVDEAPRLLFRFGPSDYLNFLAAQELLREMDPDAPWHGLSQLAQGWDPFQQPLPFMAHSFGINLVPITADGLAVVAKRGAVNRSRPRTWGVGVNEGLQRPADNNAQGAPDFYKAAARGIYEELGVTPGQSDVIDFHSFGVDSELHQYALLGTVHLSLTAEELRDVRHVGVVDKWESEEIQLVPLDARRVAHLLHTVKPWAPAAVAALVHALVYEDGSAMRVAKKLTANGITVS